MNIEETIRLWIYVHAALGGIALLSGMIALIAPKGKVVHRNAGSTFYYAMLGSAIIALGVSMAPNHVNPFLFAIGVFSLYSLVGGMRSLRFKKANPRLTFDKVFAFIMLLTGIFMVTFGGFLLDHISWILVVFGILGIQRSILDLITYNKPDKLREKWLRLHIGKMTGGYIACLSAFLVVNNTFPTYVNWFGPGLIGSLYITYWIRKVKRQTVIKTAA